MVLGIDQESLLRCIQPKDLLNTDCVADHLNAEQLAERAQRVVKFGFAALKLETIPIKGNEAHCVRSTPHLIVLRCLNRVIRKATRITPSDRDTIIRRIHTILSEGVPHRVYKYDIKSFFESLNTKLLSEQLADVPQVPRNAILILQNFLNELLERGISGLPRGIQLSATLSEYALQQFDQRLSKLPEVYYHARYVDDIVIVTSAREHQEQFGRSIKRMLPFNLQMNPLKTRVFDITVQPKSDGKAQLGAFDYLGYNFSIYETKRTPSNRLCRAVDIAIAPKKIRRIKSRLCSAVCSFLNDGDIQALERRLQLLTGNYNVRDFSTGRIRNVGLYCNYRRANSTTGLDELDSFLRALVIGSRNKLARRLSLKVPLQLRRSLLRYSFSRNFSQQTFYNFGVAELTDLTRCWRNG